MSFVSRSLLTAAIAEKNNSGMMMYRPNLIMMSVINASAEFAAGEFAEMVNESAAPSNAPMRYFIQSFMGVSITYRNRCVKPFYSCGNML